MPPNEKELNAALFDQLTLVERIERKAEGGDIEEVKAEKNGGLRWICWICGNKLMRLTSR